LLPRLDLEGAYYTLFVVLNRRTKWLKVYEKEITPLPESIERIIRSETGRRLSVGEKLIEKSTDNFLSSGLGKAENSTQKKVVLRYERASTGCLKQSFRE
jgi:hypothetical protein